MRHSQSPGRKGCCARERALSSPHQQKAKADCPKSPLVNLSGCRSHQRQPKESKQERKAFQQEIQGRMEKSLLALVQRRKSMLWALRDKSHLGHHWKKKESSQHARVQVEKALACTKTLFKDALNRSSGLFWADQTSAVPASQWRKFVSTPSSMGCASSNNSTMVLNRGMPTMLKKPSCRHNTFFRYEKSHIEKTHKTVFHNNQQMCLPLGSGANIPKQPLV